MWEDETNKNGGKLTIRLKKDNSSYFWEELVISFLSNVFPENIEKEINGVIVSCKKEYNNIQIWLRTSTNADIIKEAE